MTPIRQYANVIVPTNRRHDMAVNRSPQVATPAFLAPSYPYRPMLPHGDHEHRHHNAGLPPAHAWTSLTPPRDNPMTSHPDVVMTAAVAGDTRVFHRNIYRDLVDASAQLNITV